MENKKELVVTPKMVSEYETVDTREVIENNIYIVNLASVGNPDYRQDPTKSILPEIQRTVNSFREASGACMDYIAEWDLGGGNWAGGQIFKNSIQVAEISYNGRIWELNKKKTIFECTEDDSLISYKERN